MPFLKSLRWSVIRWNWREWKQDRMLRNQKGQCAVLKEICHQAESMCLSNLLKGTLGLPGDVLECGVFRGHSLLRLAAMIKENGSAKSLFGCDSFEGFPPGSVQEKDRSILRRMRRVETKFRSTSHVPSRIERLCRIFDFRNVTTVKGFFEESLEQFNDREFCFVHLDVDLYSSYLTCLEKLYDRVVPGGLIVFDEYRDPTWPGATQAINEFFRDKPESPRECDAGFHEPKYFVQKSLRAI